MSDEEKLSPAEAESLERVRAAILAHIELLRPLAQEHKKKRRISGGEHGTRDWIMGHLLCQVTDIIREAV